VNYPHLEHVPQKWKPVFRRGHATAQESRAQPDSTKSGCALAVFAVAAFLAGTGPAAAERLVASLTNHHVMITSNYTGVELVLFGSVERDATGIAHSTPYDIVATVIGPREALRTRRKQRVLGIWVNMAARTFVDPPSYLAVLANRPLDTITGAENRRKLQLGIADTPLPELINNDIGEVSGDPFRAALVRLMRERSLYSEEANAVTFLTPTLFRASIALPAQVPIGNYTVNVKLFADGNLIAHTDSAFEIVKVGFEQFVVDAARNHGLLYGLATALMALMTGWIASVAFRRD
jgi:uncharacterized protein (TIGR02186 family)